MCFMEFYNGRMREVVVVAVGYNDEVDDGEIFDVAGWFGVAFWSHEGKWTAAVFEYGIEEDAKSRGVFDIIACVSKPCCS